MNNQTDIQGFLKNVKNKIWETGNGLNVNHKDIDKNDELPHMVFNAKKYIGEHLFERDLTIKKLKAHCYSNSHNFSTTFGYYVGMTPKEYIIHYRLKAAKLVLVNVRFRNIPILYIAKEIGFSGTGAFSHAFKKSSGKSPAKWRREKLNL